jgi:DNA-binding MurR/RpiR family transcriptional regulator
MRIGKGGEAPPQVDAGGYAASDTESAPIALEVLDRIQRQMHGFTPRQRAVAEFILHNPESLAFLSITDIAKDAGVSQATVVRFCNVIGYSGYTHLAREAQQAIQAEFSSSGRFRLVHRMHRDSIKRGGAAVFERVLGKEMENLINLAKSIRTADFYRCVGMMTAADRMCVIGCMGSTCLAAYTGHMLAKIYPRLDLLHGHGPMTPAIIDKLTPQSLILLICFPRYPREAIELGRVAAARGSRLVAITDGPKSPAVPLATLCFYVPVGFASFMDYYAAPVTLINALITEVSERDPEKTQTALKQFDDYALLHNQFLSPSDKGDYQGRG